MISIVLDGVFNAWWNETLSNVSSNIDKSNSKKKKLNKNRTIPFNAVSIGGNSSRYLTANCLTMDAAVCKSPATGWRAPCNVRVRERIVQGCYASVLVTCVIHTHWGAPDCSLSIFLLPFCVLFFFFCSCIILSNLNLSIVQYIAATRIYCFRLN